VKEISQQALNKRYHKETGGETQNNPDNKNEVTSQEASQDQD
jgi:hypothetical protein